MTIDTSRSRCNAAKKSIDNVYSRMILLIALLQQYKVMIHVLSGSTKTLRTQNITLIPRQAPDSIDRNRPGEIDTQLPSVSKSNRVVHTTVVQKTKQNKTTAINPNKYQSAQHPSRTHASVSRECTNAKFFKTRERDAQNSLPAAIMSPSTTCTRTRALITPTS